ncbi:glycosyltransferase family 2 protein [Pedobacter sp. NJ-S-72]
METNRKFPDNNDMLKMKVSVIIPLYNAASTIKSTLESVFQQTFKDFEVIIVNDGSEDDSVAQVEQFIAENVNSGISVTLIHQENKGVSTARNVGIRAANCELIALIDSDDVWLPTKLEKQIKILEANPDVFFIGTLHNNLSLGFPYTVKDDLIEVSFRQLMIKMAPSTITSMFRKVIFEKTGYYDEKQRYAEDGNLWLRISQHYKMLIINENLAIAGGMKPLFGHSGLSGNLSGMQKGELNNIQEM